VRQRSLASGLVLAGALGVAACGFQGGVKETATANADNSLALVESIDPTGGPGGSAYETLLLEARGGSSGPRQQIAGFEGAREVHPQWIGRTTLALCLNPPVPFLVSEMKVRPVTGGGYNSGFTQALGAPATITIIQACSGDGAIAAPPPAGGPAATSAPAAADG
jgi:hypothetical protein